MPGLPDLPPLWNGFEEGQDEEDESRRGVTCSTAVLLPGRRATDETGRRRSGRRERVETRKDKRARTAVITRMRMRGTIA